MRQELNPRFRASANTQACEDVLRRVDVGGIASYEDLVDACGAGDIDEVRQNVLSAMRRLEREGMLFCNVMRVGYRRLSDAEILGQNDEFNRAAIRRKARRSAKQLSAVDYDALSVDQKKQLSAKVAVYGVVHEMARERTTRKIAASCHTEDELSVKECLKLYLQPKEEKSEED